jgi:hypothetical protein
MSSEITGQVWNIELPPNKRLVLLAMADHTDHNKGVPIPLSYIAWKTGYSENQTRLIIRSLVDHDGLIVETKKGTGNPNTYKLDFTKAKEKDPHYFDTPIKIGVHQNSTPNKTMVVEGENPNSKISGVESFKYSIDSSNPTTPKESIDKKESLSATDFDNQIFQPPLLSPKPIIKRIPKLNGKTQLVQLGEVEELWDETNKCWSIETQGKYVYIGAGNVGKGLLAGTWQNPFADKYDEKDWPTDRSKEYRDWIAAHPGVRSQLPELKGKVLVCDCGDESHCHGNLLLKVVSRPPAPKKPKQTVPAACINPMKKALAIQWGFRPNEGEDPENPEDWKSIPSSRMGEFRISARELCLLEPKFLPGQVKEVFLYLKHDKEFENFGPRAIAKYAGDWRITQKPKESPVRENPPERKMPAPKPVDEFMVYDHEQRYLGMYKDLQAQAAAKGIPYDVYLEQLRAQRSAGDGTP